MNQKANFDLARFNDKQLIIFGLGREGASTYRFLRAAFPKKKIILTDDSTNINLTEEWQDFADDLYSSLTSPAEAVELELAGSVLFKSPGIPPEHHLLEAARRAGAEITSNTGLFLELAGKLAATTPDNGETNPGHSLISIGVTGTKGKSTTATAIWHVLESCGFNAVLGGNIGKPALDLLMESEKLPEIAVLELSSHQLLNISRGPHISVVLDITGEHLDYYHTFEAYTQAKFRITKMQTSGDFLLINPGFDQPRLFASQSKASVLPYGMPGPGYPQVLSYISNGTIYYEKEAIVDVADLHVTGGHTLQNLLPAVVIAKHLGAPAAKIREALINFKSLPHRLEPVAEVGGVLYINDSLATTPEAALAAIDSFPERELVLIAGGYERNQDFHRLAEKLLIEKGRIRALLLFPVTGERLAAEIRAQACLDEAKELPFPTQTVETMPEAVQKAAAVAQTGTVVLLSPASASYNLFQNYEDRGNQFRTEVLRLGAKK